LVTPAFAQGGPGGGSSLNVVPLAAGFGMAIAAGLAALGQGKVGSSACEGMARNPAARPGIQVAMILSLAFIESLVLFTFVMIFLKAV
jgi:F-type H+-transporting ATPase subunit c